MKKERTWASAYDGTLVVNSKPVDEITDRAKRYRAQGNVEPPKQCGYCGSVRNVGVDHIDGNESHGQPENLMWACKRCNAVKANVMKRRGLGKRTRQMNAKKARGGGQMAEYAAAIKVMRGEFDGDAAAAMRTIRATPPSVRSAYTRSTWPTRKATYGPSGRRTEIPF
jgi:hypothetical protein